MRKTLIILAAIVGLFNAYAGEKEYHRTVDSMIVESLSGDVVEVQRDMSVATHEVEQQDENALQTSPLTGNWNGTRDILTEDGVSLSLSYKADNLSNIVGGLRHRSSYIHQIDFGIAIDGEKLLNWNGGSLLVHAMSNNGEEFSRFIGDAQSVSNLEAPKSTRLYQVFVQQNLMEGRLSFLAGLFDLKSEFYVADQSLLFLNSSFGVGKELSQTGINGPSIFPITSSALRVRIQPNDDISFQFAAFDAVPGSPADPTTPSLFMSTEEGALVIGEVSCDWQGIPEEGIGTGKYTLGAWFYTAEFEEVQLNAATGSSMYSTGNSGFYFLAEQSIFSASETEAFAIFARLGVANGNINRYDYNFSAGAVYTGPFSKRDTDKLGFAFTYANNSLQYKRATLLRGSSVATGELAIELTYRGQVTPWLAVQPDFQYIIHPGTDPLVGNTAVFGIRFEVGF